MSRSFQLTSNLADVVFGYAPGKVILAGEHVAVYGYSAIAFTIDRGVRVAVTTKRQDVKGPVLRANGLGFVGQVKPDPNGEGPEVLRCALKRLVELLGPRVEDLELIVESAIPGASGLGSSAALSVALIRGCSRFFNEPISKNEVIQLAMELESVFHGRASGIDHTVITEGGMILFRRGDKENLVQPIHLKRTLQVVVALTSSRQGTLQTVQALSERVRRHETHYKHIFENVEAIVTDMHLALEHGQWAKVGELMNLNQGYLNALGVSTPEIEKVCEITRNNGALGAKLTGAGGGGAIIALVDGEAASVVDACRAAGYEAFVTICEKETVKHS